MPLSLPTLTNPTSTQHYDPNQPLLLTREDTPTPSSSTNPSASDSPLPKLSDKTILGITLGILGAAILLILIWYLRHRSKARRAGDTRQSGVEKWDPVQGASASPSRSWVDVDVDVERQAAEEHQRLPRFDMNRQAHAGRVWGAPKWNAVAERMAQHERAQREVSEARRGARLSKPPPAVTRPPVGEGVRGQEVAPRGEEYVAMLWAPGHRGTLQ